MLLRLLPILFLISQNVCAQKISLYGKIIDDTNEPVKYVSIGIVNKPIGTISNDYGIFRLSFNKDSVSVNDSLRFSVIGYYSKSIALKSLFDKKTINEHALEIMLTKKATELQEILIKSDKRKIKTIGTHKTSLLKFFVNFSLSGYSDYNLGSEIGRKFSISKKNTKIESLRFMINHNNFDSVKLRINIYSIKSGKPFKNLLTDNIYTDIYKRQKGWIEVDLAQYDILVSKNIVVSLEWISKSVKGNVLSLPIIMPTTHVHFYKYGSQNKWKRFNAMSTYMELKIRQ
ncbi:MAG: carboxypeptidase-like regulatory domain-containing protein [Sphingobacteriaceae bacterium]|nr:carboxypeptidase-like regulatory domain-containing protein [Sphingobacteriaceae bacterium]